MLYPTELPGQLVSIISAELNHPWCTRQPRHPGGAFAGAKLRFACFRFTQLGYRGRQEKAEHARLHYAEILVERKGIEPSTFALRTRRSPN